MSMKTFSWLLGHQSILYSLAFTCSIYWKQICQWLSCPLTTWNKTVTTTQIHQRKNLTSSPPPPPPPPTATTATTVCWPAPSPPSAVWDSPPPAWGRCSCSAVPTPARPAGCSGFAAHLCWSAALAPAPPADDGAAPAAAECNKDGNPSCWWCLFHVTG